MTYGPSAWPPGGGEMAQRIRALDWAATPLGPVEAWSGSLRTAVDMVLAMPGPANILWGAAHIQLYNDAYAAEIARDRHPALLGRPAAEGWPEIYAEVLAPVVEAAFEGRATRLADLTVALRGPNGQLEERTFDSTWSPIHDASGAVGGALEVLVEVTDGRRTEASLRESEVRHRLLIGSWAQAVWETDANGVVTADSPSWRTYTGQTLEEWLGYGWLDAVHPDDRAYAERQWREAIAARGLVNAEFRLRAPDGGWRWTNVRAAPVPDARGRVEKWVGMNIDIDARRRAETALRESEQRFRALVTAGTYSIYRMSPDWRVMYRLDSESLANTSEPIADWADRYILDEDRPRVFAAIAEAIRTKSLFELEHRVRLSDGGIAWVLSRAVPLLGPDGEITEWFGAGSDVTDRRVAAARLREGEERHRTELERQVRERTAELRASRDLLQATMDSSLDMIQVFEAVRDEAGDIVDFRWVLNNHTSETYYGEVRGQSLLERNPGVVEEGIFDAFKRVVETGQPDQAERHYVHEQFDGWFFQSAVKLGDGVGTTTKDITDWKAAQAELLDLQEKVAQAKLRESEERLRQFGEASQDILWIRDAETLQWQYLTPAFKAIYGLSRDEALSGDNYRNWLDLIVPEDRERAAEAIRRVRAGEHVTFDYRIRRPSDGGIRWLRNTDFPIRNGSGEITLIGGIGHDATERRATEQRLTVLMEGIPQLVWRAAHGGDLTWSSPQWSAYTGQALADSLGKGWLDALHPDDRGAAIGAWAEAEARGSLQVEYRICNATQKRYRWFQSRAIPVRDEEGNILEWLGTSTDVDELRQLQEEQKVLVAELQHRTRNLIAVVRSIAGETLRSSSTLTAFRSRFNDRLAALSRVQGLLSRSDQEPVTLDALLRMEFDALGTEATVGSYLTLDGPKVELRKSTVQPLALALHELATNARKYGALAAEEGRLRVAWRVQQADGQGRRLRLEWVEEGALRPDSQDERPTEGGYGRQLIERALPYALDAQTSYVLDDAGVRCTIDLPLARGSAEQEEDGHG